MAETVVILGAGASREAGVPCMSQFIERLQDIGQPKTDHFQPDFERFQEAFDEYQRLGVKTNIDIDNIEAFYGALEVACLCGRLGNLRETKLRDSIRSCQRVIARTVERSMTFGKQEQMFQGPSGYHNMAVVVRKVIEQYGHGKIAFLTFNYDVGLECGLHRENLDIDYGIEPRRQNAVPVLKLHGSINWFRRPQSTNEVDFIPAAELFDDVSDGVDYVEPSLMIERKANAGEAEDGYPVIVPPSWSKLQYNQQVRQVWRLAAEHLSDASHVYVFGYSMPPTDEFFRHLLTVGMQGSTRLKRFGVFDPSPEVNKRFEPLFTAATRNRYVFDSQQFGGFGHVPIRDLYHVG